MSTASSIPQQSTSRRNVLKTIAAALIAATLPVAPAVQAAADSLFPTDDDLDQSERRQVIQAWINETETVQAKLAKFHHFLTKAQASPPDLAQGEEFFAFVILLDNALIDFSQKIEGFDSEALIEAISGWPCDAVNVRVLIKDGDGPLDSLQASVDTMKEDYGQVGDDLQSLLDSYPPEHFRSHYGFEEILIERAYQKSKGA